MEVVYQLWELFEGGVIISKVQIGVHVVNVVPLSVLRYPIFSHTQYNFHCSVSGQIAPPTQVEPQGPVGGHVGSPNQLTRGTKTAIIIVAMIIISLMYFHFGLPTSLIKQRMNCCVFKMQSVFAYYKKRKKKTNMEGGSFDLTVPMAIVSRC